MPPKKGHVAVTLSIPEEIKHVLDQEVSYRHSSPSLLVVDALERFFTPEKAERSTLRVELVAVLQRLDAIRPHLDGFEHTLARHASLGREFDHLTHEVERLLVQHQTRINQSLAQLVRDQQRQQWPQWGAVGLILGFAVLSVVLIWMR